MAEDGAFFYLGPNLRGVLLLVLITVMVVRVFWLDVCCWFLKLFFIFFCYLLKLRSFGLFVSLLFGLVCTYTVLIYGGGKIGFV